MTVMERIKGELDAHSLVLYMKGTPEVPMCGHSATAMAALREAGAVSLHTVNVMADPEIRAALPRYSHWPTFPQLFVQGELIGGDEIVCELAASGELGRIIAEATQA